MGGASDRMNPGPRRCAARFWFSGQTPNPSYEYLIPLLKPGKKGYSCKLPRHNLEQYLIESTGKTSFSTNGKFLDDNEVFSESHGQPWTCWQHWAVVNDWLVARDNRLFTAVVFTDLSKALDNTRSYWFDMLNATRLVVPFWSGSARTESENSSQQLVIWTGLFN